MKDLQAISPIVKMERVAAHDLLDKVLDGGHEGNISALLSTMYVYAEAVEDRTQSREIRESLETLEKRLQNIKISTLHRRLDHGRFPENKGG